MFIAPDFVSTIVGVFQSRCHAVDRKSCHVFVIDKVWKSDIADSTLGLCDALDQCTAVIGFQRFVGGFFLTSQWQFWVLAVLVGMFQGGVQALSRSHFAKIIPAEKSGEYFGLFDICGKGASFLGTMIVSVGSQLTGSANVGIGMLALLFAVGFVLFRVSCRTEGAKQV